MKLRILIIFIAALCFQNVHSQCTRTGNFVAADPSQYPISGDATIIDNGNELMVRFEENFATVQGAMLEVFLSKTGTLDTANDLKISSDPLDRGSATGTPISGVHEFAVPSGITVEDFDHVLIQCTTINALWGNVALGDNEGNCGTTTLTRDIALESVRIFPSPASQYLHIDNLPKEANFSIYNILGAKQNIIQQGTAIDISSLKRGPYIITITHQQNKITKRFIKE